VTTEAQVEHEGYRKYRDVLTETASRLARQFAWPSGPSSFLADSLPDWRTFADTNRALEELVRRGVRLGILSNVDRDLLSATRRHFTVDFDLIVTAEDVRSYKPAHGHFLAARKHIDQQVWLHAAQSHFHDVMPCVELGIPVVWVNRGKAAEREPRPTAEVPDLAGLVSWLDQ
jgi:2-haloacid dehalogenase/putative hydrolase of the HAD superfamily